MHQSSRHPAEKENGEYFDNNGMFRGLTKHDAQNGVAHGEAATPFVMMGRVNQTRRAVLPC